LSEVPYLQFGQAVCGCPGDRNATSILSPPSFCVRQLQGRWARVEHCWPSAVGTETTNPGVVLAFSKLAGDKDIPAFVGPGFSTQIHAIAPDIQRLGKPVMIGGTDPQLTHMGYPWLFRFRPNDIYSARVIADYGVNTLGKKKWAIVHSTDAFGTSGMKKFD
jgi:hypothetical protein